jgi:ABC-type Na+ efflux pump permease subunit
MSHQLKIIIKKDILDIIQDKGILIPILIVPMIFSLVLPIVIFSFDINDKLMTSVSGLSDFFKQLKLLPHPIFITDHLLPLYAVLVYLFLPLFMIIPIMLATVFASTSFLGEKEHKTLEGLLYTPITVKNLILGKVLASAIPALLLTWVSILCYITIVNILGRSSFGHMILPNITWLLASVIVMPLLVILSILLVIGGSQYLKTSKSAQGIAMLLIMPIIMTMVSQMMGVFILGLFETLIGLAILVVITVLVFFIVVRQFNFEKFILNS